ncbi:unnamed protein product [Plutella xylostella]|uniref:(diamondback moth) hypothetical protein n=1 Tax=Plutella xylostella TaxID=51655 RepID=A0A8S4G201_PLUXY|nr:unnamed protein product [Plutella xylostella]
MTSIKVIQANIQHSYTGAAALRRKLEENPTTIALVTEPLLRRGKPLELHQGNTFYCNSFSTVDCSKIRSLILIPKCYTANKISNLCTPDLTVVGLTLDESHARRVLYIASAYLPGDGSMPPPELISLVTECKINNIPLIIGCDANAHSSLWGCRETNKRGRDLLEFLLSNNLSVLNRGSEPTFVTARAQTIPDVTITNSQARDMVVGWRVLPDVSCADHRWISFKLTSITPKPRQYRNPRKTNRVEFHDRLLKGLSDTQPYDNLNTYKLIDEAVDEFTNIIVKSYEESCPLVTVSASPRKWWCNSLEKMRTNVRKLFNRAKNTKKEEDWKAFQLARNKFKKETRAKTRESWRNFCGSIQSETKAARVKKCMSNDSQNQLDSLKKPDGTYTKNETERNSLLLLTHFPGCEMLAEESCHQEQLSPIINSSSYAESIAAAVINEEKVRWAITSFLPFKSPVADGIVPALLQWEVDIISLRLVGIFRACIALGYIPKGWREVKVVFLPKAGKDDYTSPKAYRPISLSSFLLKTLERLCDRYIRDGALSVKPVHPNQHAYQPAALEIILELPPLDIIIKQEAKAAAIRLSNMGLWSTNTTAQGHSRILDIAKLSAPGSTECSDTTIKTFIFNRSYTIQRDQCGTSDENNYDINIYIDGAKNKKGSGGGVFCPELNLQYSVSFGNKATVFQAEAASLLDGATQIKDTKNSNICFYTDSMAILGALGRTVEAYMQRLARAYPDKVTLVSGGISFEGRPINYLRISTTNFQDSSKPVVFMQSLLHCREWIGQAATLYALEKLLVDNTESDLINNIDWIIVPTANPDGYVHTHEANRYWRKNRKDGLFINDICMGVDLNRNYDIFWSTESSNSVCSDTFHGRAPFSEPETAVTKKILDEHKDRIELFLDIHSFGSYVLYGYGSGQLPSNGLALHLVGVLIGEAIDAVKLRTNPNYTVGNVALTLYPASGSSQDYAQSLGIPYSYTLELPAYRGSATLTGFLVDPEFVEQAGYETWEGIKAGARFALNSYRTRKGIH